LTQVIITAIVTIMIEHTVTHGRGIPRRVLGLLAGLLGSGAVPVDVPAPEAGPGSAIVDWWSLRQRARERNIP
jgi:hypothetical protein